MSPAKPVRTRIQEPREKKKKDGDAAKDRKAAAKPKNFTVAAKRAQPKSDAAPFANAAGDRVRRSLERGQVQRHQYPRRKAPPRLREQDAGAHAIAQFLLPGR